MIFSGKNIGVYSNVFSDCDQSYQNLCQLSRIQSVSIDTQNDVRRYPILGYGKPITINPAKHTVSFSINYLPVGGGNEKCFGLYVSDNSDSAIPNSEFSEQGIDILGTGKDMPCFFDGKDFFMILADANIEFNSGLTNDSVNWNCFSFSKSFINSLSVNYSANSPMTASAGFVCSDLQISRCQNLDPSSNSFVDPNYGLAVQNPSSILYGLPYPISEPSQNDAIILGEIAPVNDPIDVYLDMSNVQPVLITDFSRGYIKSLSLSIEFNRIPVSKTSSNIVFSHFISAPPKISLSIEAEYQDESTLKLSDMPYFGEDRISLSINGFTQYNLFDLTINRESSSVSKDSVSEKIDLIGDSNSSVVLRSNKPEPPLRYN